MNGGQQGQPDEKTLEFGFHNNLDCLICMMTYSYSIVLHLGQRKYNYKIGGSVFAGSAISVAKKSVCSSCQSDRLILSPGPRRRRELLDLGDFRGGQAGEQVVQIIE